MEVLAGDQGRVLRRVALVVLVLLALFLAVKSIAEIKQIKYIGGGVMPSNTIVVQGDGEAFAIPDTAQFSFSVVEKAGTVKAAQEAATKKMDAITKYLKDQKVEDKNIKTVDYSVNPQYDYISESCIAGMPCKPGRQVLSGYEVRQTIQVKVKDTPKAGELLTGIGEKGASELSGLTFTVEDEDALKAQARGQAIDKAKARAKELADKLGVSFVRIVSFNENSGGYPPYYARDAYGGAAENQTKAVSAPEAAPLPMGENKIVSNVTITYEIR